MRRGPLPNPSFNKYAAYLRYQTYDVTALLAAENYLEVTLGNGWYKGRLGFDGGAENRWSEQYLLGVKLTLVGS